MTTLRVFLGAPPDPAVAVPWALFDASGRLQAGGVDPPSHWPAAAVREAVVACTAVRVVALALPPMPATRRAAAVGFMIEDQLAAPVDAQAIAVGEPDRNGVTLARITARTLLSALADPEARFSRVVAEPDLAEPHEGWRWCARDQDGFVRRNDGSAFAVGAPAMEDELPAELAIALANAARAGEMPATIEVQAPCSAEQCAQWQARYGAVFHRRSPWQWEHSSRFGQAPDLRVALAAPRTTVRAPGVARRFRPAIALVVLAGLLHVVATAGTWVARRIELARVNAELSDVAAQAGVRDVASSDASSGIARAFAQARHAAGLSSPADAVPLLARIAGPIASLPDPVVKSATYSGGAWTLELAPLDDALVAQTARQLVDDDLPVVHAKTTGGVRMRVGPVR